MVKTTSFRSWNLNATNVEETVRFFRELLGAEDGQSHPAGGVNVTGLRLAGIGIGLFDASGGPRPGVPHHTIGIEGPDTAEALSKEIEAKGYKVEGVRPHGDGPGYSVYVDDPNGNHIELSYDP